MGSIDLLAIEPGHELDGVIEALLGETIRTARNKGCTVVEVVRPDDASELERWNRQGFAGASPLLERQIAVAAARR